MIQTWRPCAQVALAILVAITQFSGTRPVAAETVEEKFPDGKTQIKYSIGEGGKRDGEFTEYFPNGQYKVRAHYAKGEFDGVYVEFYENGKVKLRSTYRAGKLNGKHAEMNERGQTVLTANYVNGFLDGPLVHFENGKSVRAELFKNGELAAGRSSAEIKKTLTAILGKPKDDQDAALRQLAAYRYLCGLPYANMSIDADYTKQAQAAAVVLEKLGRLDHDPPNPGGISDEQYELGRKGAGSSNLAVGPKTLVESVDMWMDDSDKSNIDRLGHRRWCLNPAMMKSGFGMSGKYSTMWAFDSSQSAVPDYDFISYPPRGVAPTEFFHPGAAWSVSLNPVHFAKPDDKLMPNIFPVNGKLEKTGDALPLSYTHVSNEGFGVNNCIIFQPDKSAVAPDAKYLVEIDGLTAADGKTPAPIHYFVQFVSLMK